MVWPGVRTNTVTATIPVGDTPLGVAANTMTNILYVVNYGDQTVSVISGQQPRNCYHG